MRYVAFVAGILLAFSSMVSPADAQSAASAGLSGEELAGKKLFLQRCSICHLPPLHRPGDPQPYGPRLEGVVRDAETEKRAREFITKGSPRMPGFQYGLKPEEIDAVIAYLKTLQEAAP